MCVIKRNKNLNEDNFRGVRTCIFRLDTSTQKTIDLIDVSEKKRFLQYI